MSVNVEGMTISMMSMIIAATFGAGLGVWRYGWPGREQFRRALPVFAPAAVVVAHHGHFSAQVTVRCAHCGKATTQNYVRVSRAATRLATA